jgi:uncharacterized protein (TIGR03382 family)
MAERYAMYNMFLGLRAATQSYDPSCAVQLLQATRRGGSTWNAEHSDPDIAADLALVDEYLANLTTHPVVGTYPDSAGAPVSPPDLATCATQLPPPPTAYPDPEPMPMPIDTVDYDSVGCSAGGTTGGLPVLVAAVAAIFVRRRRRW